MGARDHETLKEHAVVYTGLVLICKNVTDIFTGPKCIVYLGMALAPDSPASTFRVWHYEGAKPRDYPLLFFIYLLNV